MNGESMKHQVAKVNAYKDRLLALAALVVGDVCDHYKRERYIDGDCSD